MISAIFLSPPWHLGETITRQIDQSFFIGQPESIDRLGTDPAFYWFWLNYFAGKHIKALDLPALDRPANATSMPVSGGKALISGALVKKLVC